VVAEADREKTRTSPRPTARRNGPRGRGCQGHAHLRRSLRQEPQLYKFAATLQAYEKILSGNTTIFLPADAEVFRLLGDAGKSKKGKSP